MSEPVTRIWLVMRIVLIMRGLYPGLL